MNHLSDKKHRFLLGLSILEAVQRPHEGFTQAAIADACGCTQANIYLLERNIKRKLANAILFQECNEDLRPLIYNNQPQKTNDTSQRSTTK